MSQSKPVSGQPGTQSASLPAAESRNSNQPKRVMGFRDLVLFYVVTGISLRWIATAAAAGPSSIVIWMGAWLAFYIPLAFSVVELSSRYPDEGGLYVWSKKAFGDFSGFMSAWAYWTSNLPYFPAVLYFAASNVIYIRQSAWGHLSNDTTFYIIFSLLTLTLATVVNVVGLNVGKWLHNLGAVAMWIPAVIVIVMGGIALHRFGSANAFTLRTMTPSVHFKDIIFWSLLVFAFGGSETGSFLGGEIKNPRRTIPWAVFAAGVTVAFCYIIGTVGVLVALPSTEVSNLQGLVQAIPDCAEQCGRGRRLPGCGGAAAIRRGHRPFSAAGVWSTASPVEDSLGRVADAICCGSSVHLSGAGWDQRQRRLRRARQHDRHRLLHPLPIRVCRRDQAAARTRGAGGNPRSGREARRRVDLRDRAAYDDSHNPAVRRAAGG